MRAVHRAWVPVVRLIESAPPPEKLPSKLAGELLPTPGNTYLQKKAYHPCFYLCFQVVLNFQTCGCRDATFKSVHNKSSMKDVS